MFDFFLFFFLWVLSLSWPGILFNTFYCITFLCVIVIGVYSITS